MNQHTQQLIYRYEGADRSDHEYDRLSRNLRVPEDSVAGIAYAISEWAISWLGPMFWVCLVYLLVVAELGNSPPG